ncbi:hypothetical protein GCM10009680_87480 [Streptomyces yatensis]|uniref:Uncharacterized protein n=1 Tax=Streptomyces yatensis TaxID=155177 RepID=A0ABN2JP20_9ACTN
MPALTETRASDLHPARRLRNPDTSFSEEEAVHHSPQPERPVGLMTLSSCGPEPRHAITCACPTTPTAPRKRTDTSPHGRPPTRTSPDTTVDSKLRGGAHPELNAGPVSQTLASTISHMPMTWVTAWHQRMNGHMSLISHMPGRDETDRAVS